MFKKKNKPEYNDKVPIQSKHKFKRYYLCKNKIIFIFSV